MANKVKRKKKVLKIKKKKWVEISAPNLFNGMSLGKTYVVAQEDAVGKSMTANLMNITRDPKKQSINVSFIITGIKGEKLTTSLTKYAFQPSSIRRMVRRGKDRVDLSFIAKTSDNVRIRLKPILVTRSSTSKAVQTSIRKRAQQVVEAELAKITKDKFLEELMQRAFQRRIFDQVKKILPLATCDIRMAEILPEKRVRGEQPIEENSEPAEEKKEEPESVKEEVKPEAPKEEKKEAPKPVEEKPKVEEKPTEPAKTPTEATS